MTTAQITTKIDGLLFGRDRAVDATEQKKPRAMRGQSGKYPSRNSQVECVEHL